MPKKEKKSKDREKPYCKTSSSPVKIYSSAETSTLNSVPSNSLELGNRYSGLMDTPSLLNVSSHSIEMSRRHSTSSKDNVMEGLSPGIGWKDKNSSENSSFLNLSKQSIELSRRHNESQDSSILNLSSGFSFKHKDSPIPGLSPAAKWKQSEWKDFWHSGHSPRLSWTQQDSQDSLNSGLSPGVSLTHNESQDLSVSDLSPIMGWSHKKSQNSSISENSSDLKWRDDRCYETLSPPNVSSPSIELSRRFSSSLENHPGFISPTLGLKESKQKNTRVQKTLSPVIGDRRSRTCFTATSSVTGQSHPHSLTLPSPYSPEFLAYHHHCLAALSYTNSGGHLFNHWPLGSPKRSSTDSIKGQYLSFDIFYVGSEFLYL